MSSHPVVVCLVAGLFKGKLRKELVAFVGQGLWKIRSANPPPFNLALSETQVSDRTSTKQGAGLPDPQRKTAFVRCLGEGAKGLSIQRKVPTPFCILALEVSGLRRSSGHGKAAKALLPETFDNVWVLQKHHSNPGLEVSGHMA